MRIAFPFRLLSSVFGLLLLISTSVSANVTNEEAGRLLPDSIGDLRAISKAELLLHDDSKENGDEKALTVSRRYRSNKGDNFLVTIVKTRTDRGAYSLYSREIKRLISPTSKPDGLGTVAASDSSGHLLVYKGLTFVSISDESRKKNAESLITFARLLVEPLDRGEGEIPVLVRHLPEWEKVQQSAVYSVSLQSLQEAAGHRPVLDAINFTGGTEAITALYDSSRLVIVEHTTPQLASDNDARINGRINELKSSGQSAVSAYRRVGNYAVFVFDAPDETTATQLIDKIAYEQVVQWLGNNPHWFERAEREYRRTTAGVILAVFKASGLSLLVCLGIGGIFGSIVFRRRRAQQATAHIYSDAGGMLRLNIDEMTQHVDGSRLLGKGDG